MLFLCVLFLIATSCLQTVSCCQRSEDIITNQPVYTSTVSSAISRIILPRFWRFQKNKSMPVKIPPLMIHCIHCRTWYPLSVFLPMVVLRCIDNSLITPPPAPACLPAPGAECGGERAEAPLVCTGVPLLGQDCRQHRQPGQQVELQTNIR